MDVLVDNKFHPNPNLRNKEDAQVGISNDVIADGKAGPTLPQENRQKIEEHEKKIEKLEEQPSVVIQPPVVADERTMQLALVCLTVLAIAAMAFSVYSSGITPDTIILPIITGITGLLGGKALSSTGPSK